MRDNYAAITNLNLDGSFKFNNPLWFPNCGTNGTICSNNVDGGRATQDMERQEYQLWLNKLSSKGIKIGSTNSVQEAKKVPESSGTFFSFHLLAIEARQQILALRCCNATYTTIE